MGHYPSSGQPYADAGSLEPFAPTGEPTKLNEKPGQNPQTEGDEALAEFAPVQGAKRYSSMRVEGQTIAIPKEGERSLANRKV